MLKTINVNQLKNFITDQALLRRVQKENEKVFSILPPKNKEMDSLLKFEIALRRCIRVGVFKK